MTKTMRFAPSGTRTAIRRAVVRKFLFEKPGTGKRHLATKYRYVVEETTKGRFIDITRPAGLNKGIDFVVHLRGFHFRLKNKKGHKLPDFKKTNPRHKDVLVILRIMKNQNLGKWMCIERNIYRVFHCQNLQSVNELKRIKIYHSRAQDFISAEDICLIIKWLFVEQDVTYWNYSGRMMFLESLQKRRLISVRN